MLIFLFQPKDPKTSLKDASEGYIGKLQILRSGKARYGKEILNVFQSLLLFFCGKKVFRYGPILPASGSNQNNGRVCGFPRIPLSPRPFSSLALGGR